MLLNSLSINLETVTELNLNSQQRKDGRMSANWTWELPHSLSYVSCLSVVTVVTCMTVWFHLLNILHCIIILSQDIQPRYILLALILPTSENCFMNPFQIKYKYPRAPSNRWKIASIIFNSDLIKHFNPFQPLAINYKHKHSFVFIHI